MNTRIKPMPEVGFTTRTGRRIYGQNDYDRDKRIVLTAAVSLTFMALLGAVMGAM